jgi:23S rRNA pseudouridine2605 synthase
MNSPGKPVRLQVYMARSGIASRRSCEDIIARGRVRVNGVTVMEPGTKVGEADTVELDGRAVKSSGRKLYVALNKPPEYLCASVDAFGRKLAIDLLKEDFPERLFSIGRLDYRSSGLILFTNDGDFARAISHPSARIEKEYVVETDKEIPIGLLEDFKAGIKVGEEIYKMKSYVRTSPYTARFVLIEGKNREIRKVLESGGIRPLRLYRSRIGNLSVSGIASGGFRTLSQEEKAALISLAEGKDA